MYTKKTLTKSIIVFSLTILLAIFVLIVGGNNVFGWFTISDSNNVGNNVDVFEDKTLVDYYVYIYDAKVDGTIEYLYSSSNNNSIDLHDNNDATLIQQYDTVFTERNKYTPFIIRIQFSNLENDNSMSLSGTVYVSITRNMSIVSSHEHRYSSDILRFSPFKDATAYSKLLEEDGANKFYEYVNEGKTFNNVEEKGYYLNTQTEQKIAAASIVSDCFPTGEVVNNNKVKKERISFNISYTENDWHDGKLNIFIYVCYDPLLMSELGYTGLSNTTEIGARNIQLPNDLLNLYVYHSEN